MSVCDKCLNDCKCQCSCCNNYNNPNHRQFDYRCRVCNKKVPKLRKLCQICNAWLGILQRYFSILGIIPSFRSAIRKYVNKLEEAEQ